MTPKPPAGGKARARKPAEKSAATERKGLLPKLKGFIDALGDRYQRVLQVIDEALASDNLKDKIWAVDLILKRTPPTDGASAAGRKHSAGETSETEAESPPLPGPAELDALSEVELLNRIREVLGEDVL